MEKHTLSGSKSVVKWFKNYLIDSCQEVAGSSEGEEGELLWSRVNGCKRA